MSHRQKQIRTLRAPGAWTVFLGLAFAASWAWTGAARAADFVGSGACLGCHSDKEPFKKKPHGKTLAAKGIDFEKACETCHGPGSLHAGAGGDRNNPDFATVKNPDKLAADEASSICLSCHKQKNLNFWKTSSHRQEGLSCNKCHSVHSGKGHKQLVKDPVETCLDCHKGKKAEIQLASHHPLIEGKMTCTGCHNPHGGVEGNLAKETVEDTCFKCHADKAGPYAFEHPPVIENCGLCHKPHGSPNDFLLKQPQPFLCQRCHKWPHTNRNATGGTNAMSVDILEKRGRCTDCHREIHGSDRHNAFKN